MSGRWGEGGHVRSYQQLCFTLGGTDQRAVAFHSSLLLLQIGRRTRGRAICSWVRRSSLTVLALPCVKSKCVCVCVCVSVSVCLCVSVCVNGRSHGNLCLYI